MKNKIFAFTLCLALCVCMLIACGGNDVSKLEYELNADGQSYTVAGIGKETGTDIVIPDTYKGLPVTRISGLAFSGCKSLTSITIPDSVTTIGAFAFEGCTNLVQTDNGVQYIDTWVVDCDTSVTSVTIRPGTKGICYQSFQNCSKLTSITIPDGLTTIGGNTFYGCSSLTSITIPNSVTSIGDSAFSGCESLTSITIGDSVTSIGNKAFFDCKSLTSITIPNSVTNIGEFAFDSYSVFIETVNGVQYADTWVIDCDPSVTSATIRPGTKGICPYAFQNCKSLTSITIPDGVTSIGSNAFKDCSSLTSITIPDGVTSIGDSAFYFCNQLTSITIPDSVTNIGNTVFSWCANLTSITFQGTQAQWNDIAKRSGWKSPLIIHCTDGDIDPLK